MTQLYPLIKYVSDKKYDNKFWKYQDTKLTSNSLFDRFEFSKNIVYESYTQGYQYLVIEKMNDKKEGTLIKLKKENDLPLSELMQYDIHNQLEFIQGENSNEIIAETNSYFSVNYDFKWYINGPHRIGVDCQIL